MNIKNVNINDLKPYENNPRNNKDAIEYVKNSINEFGFKVPLVIDKQNIIVCGHTRYLAAKKLHMKELPCIVADDLTDEQIKAFRLADNKVSEFSEWDIELLNDELLDIDLDMDMFGFGFEDDEEEICFEDLEKENEKQGNVIVTINIPFIANWNLVEDEIKRIAEQIDASLAVKLQ